MEKPFSKDLNKLMQFPKEGIFSTVLVKSENYNYNLICLAKEKNKDQHTIWENCKVYVQSRTIMNACNIWTYMQYRKHARLICNAK